MAPDAGLPLRRRPRRRLIVPQSASLGSRRSNHPTRRRL